MAQAFKYGGVRNMARTGRFTMSEFKQRIRVLNQRQCTTAAQIDATLSEMAELTESAAISGVVRILLEEFAQLQGGTPVDTGRARAAWLITGDRGAIEFVPALGQVSYTPQVPDMVSLMDADVIIVLNNVEYILALNAGWSKKQPAGFIDGFLLRVKRRLQDLATELSQVR